MNGDNSSYDLKNVVPYMVPNYVASPNAMVSKKKRQRLLEKASRAPGNLRFSEICRLAEWYGWRFDRQQGTSHRIYINPAITGGAGEMMNFQNRNGQAKPWQVRQLVEAIEELISRGED